MVCVAGVTVAVGVVDYVLLGVEICMGLFCVGVCCSVITDNMLGHGGPS